LKYLWVGLGGCAGAIARYWLSIVVYDRMGTRFPYGTFVINISGCFLIGLMITYLDARTNLPTAWRLLLPVGFVGAYTTFSTFEFETYRTAAQGHVGIALLNIALSVVVGYAAVYLGILSAKLLV
jgi:CrcB protein